MNNIITGTLSYTIDVSFLSEWYMNYFLLGVFFILGAIFGCLLMWYYWRRYKTTDKFKEEVNERLEEIKNIIKNK